jgi:hypothetical protein
VWQAPGSKTAIVSYNAGVVKIYNATDSIARFKSKYYFSCRKKTPSTTQALQLQIMMSLDWVPDPILRSLVTTSSLEEFTTPRLA